MSANPVPEPWLKHRFGDVWRLRTDAAARAAMPALRAPGLPDVVVQRAARLRDAEQSDRFLYAHWRLHEVLAARTDQPQWNLSAMGKPDAGPARPAFNLARREAWAAFVVGSDATALGIDLEVLHEVDDPIDLAQGHFTVREIAALRAEPAPDRSFAFLRTWTRKEAVMKAVGLGVSLPARSFQVGAGPAAITLHVTHEGQAWDVELESLPDGDDTMITLARAVPATKSR